MPTALILTESDDLSRPARLPLAEYEVVVLAFWASPEFAARVIQSGAKQCWRLNEFITDYASLVRRAYMLAHDFLSDAPPYREVIPLRAVENIIANALFIPLTMSVLHDALRARLGMALTVAFLSRSDTQRAFADVNVRQTPTFPLCVLHESEASKAHPAGGRFAAWLKLVAEARRDGDWRNLFWVPVETLDTRYTWRSRLDQRAPAQRGGTLFYSSYINFSRALAKHAAALAVPPLWVVNLHSAHRGLPNGAHVQELWQFGKPATAAHRGVVCDARNLFAAAPNTADGFPLRAVLAASGAVQEIVNRLLPLLLAEIDLMHACLTTVQPQAVWVANRWGGEGCVLQVANAYGIPVTQVQHGMLEEYYAFAPIYTERFLVWDDFWKNIVNPAEQARVEIMQSGYSPIANPAPLLAEADNADKRITFFTAPPQVVALWNPSVVVWEIVTLLHTLMAGGHPVTLRAHPMDQLEPYIHAWRELFGELPIALEWNKGRPLEPLLARTRLALMVFSTVLLDCRAHGIPVRGLGWYPFLLQSHVARAGYVQYLNDITEISKTAMGGDLWMRT